jgi:hypothetical protein
MAFSASQWSQAADPLVQGHEPDTVRDASSFFFLFSFIQIPKIDSKFKISWKIVENLENTK